ncbi:MAG: hypothetical protein C4582_11725 [Desulfobacteraceae bacterium]|nr:MAG: hypothetical protein C4582_11725 [Desulfobacteraceae bacterium]
MSLFVFLAFFSAGEAIAACWECWGPDLPDPCRNTLYSVAVVQGSNGNDLWAVGAKGTILRWNGTTWSKVASPTTEILRSVAMANSNLGFAVGHGGWVLKWDGTSWAKSDAKTTNWFRTVGFVPGSNGSKAWAACDYAGVGYYMNWNGSQWDIKFGGKNQIFGTTLWGLSMIDANNGWAVGEALHQVSETQLQMKGQITRWNGASWSGTDYPVEKEGKLYGIEMLSNNEGWLVGEKGIIARWNGTTWSQLAGSPTEKDLRAVDLRTASDGWAVGEEGTILRWNGTAWASVASPVSYDLYGVVAMSATDAWAVGEFGTIIRWDGTKWNKLFAPTIGKLEDISVVPGTDGSDIWALGGSKLVRWNGSEWQAVQGPPSSSYYAVGMVSQNDGWAPGPGGRFYRWNGSSWTLAGTWQSAYEIQMLSANNGWAVGWSGKIQRWNGTDWSLVTSPTTTMLQAISAVGTNDIWAAGYSGTVVRYNGTAWSIVNTPDATGLNDVSMVSASDGWAVGFVYYANSQCQGPFLRWNGTSWTRPVYSQASKTLYGVSLVQTPSGATGWAVGDGGEVYQLKNGAWTAGCTYTANSLYGVALVSRYEAWAVGDGGVILHWVDPSRPATVPTVSTNVISSIGDKSATGGGNVSSTGGTSVTARGVCWKTSQNPTKADTCTSNGSGTGGFSSTISGLAPSTTYYVRAYATNSVGTAYGSNRSFTTGAANRVYVDTDGICGNRVPCFETVGSGFGQAGEGASIMVMLGNYPESLDIVVDKQVIINFGYDYDYATTSGSSVLGNIILKGGPVTFSGQLTIGGPGVAASLNTETFTAVSSRETSKILCLSPASSPSAAFGFNTPEGALWELFALRGQLPAESTTVKDNPELKSALEEVVIHFYRTILGRAPDKQTLDLWVNSYLGYFLDLDVDISLAAGQMGRMMFRSPEYEGRNRSGAEFITDCYSGYLFREPNQEEISAHAKLDMEHTTALVSGSEEFKALLHNGFQGFWGDPLKNQISHIYLGLLDRLAWGDELHYWTVRMEDIKDRRAGSQMLGEAIVESEEFISLHPRASEQAESLYLAYTGNFVSRAEAGFLGLEIESGRLTIGELIRFLSGTAELNDLRFNYKNPVP